MTTRIDEGKLKDLLGQLTKIKAGSKADDLPLKDPISSGPSGEEVIRGSAGQAAAAKRAERLRDADIELPGNIPPSTAQPGAIKQGIDDVEAVLPRGRQDPTLDLSKLSSADIKGRIEPTYTKPKLERQPGESGTEYNARVQQIIKDLESQAAKSAKPQPTLGDRLPIPPQGPIFPTKWPTIDTKALDTSVFGHAALGTGLYVADKYSKNKKDTPQVPATIKPQDTPAKTEPQERPNVKSPTRPNYSLIPDTNESIETDDIMYIKSAMQRLKI